jgi:branched-chain amino acid transport system ATP-binding protein
MSILAVESITVNFEALRALSNVSFSVEEGSITSLVGPNGAGKTTVFNVISGLIRPSAGKIRFEGRRIDRLEPHEVARAGIGRTFQDPRVFKGMSVLGNAMVGARLRASRPLYALLRDRTTREEWKNAQESLSFPEQRFLSLARTLCSEPKVLLLDEPTVGLDRRAIAWFIRRLRELIARTGITVLLIEHNMDVVMGISDQVHLMVQGEVVASGTTADIRKHEKMIEAYLGDRYVAAGA